ncbi:TIGR03571 family LLM class oxidoreductase [Moraxella cuniculi]|uniref:Methylenetetrahydromethanopterin reductase n=1 Tax=Moraxella cuniculi TaxID=34061 RepID=A0A448GWY9_9GAMM|nr:TIGR03571 family LLM class oxidoreductase [Moraxella cuniculi]VEG13241.1 methylenetetrahydromethanopterin reductase [Moraxella cuniculi]
MQNFNIPPKLANHAGFSQIFQKDKLTFGLIAPFKGYAEHIPDNLTDIGDTAVLAEKLGFSALWVRDVPFFDPNFGDVGQGLDPIVTLGFLTAKTHKIALGTAGLVAPLRSPIHIAKTAVSLATLSDNRFVLGLSSGDRPIEYPAFQAAFENRAERFRESIEMIKTLTEQTFPHYQGKHYGNLTGELDLLPKPTQPLPIVAIGRARQEMQWLANVPDAWIWHGVDPKQTANIVKTLAELNQDGFWHPFGYANFVEVLENPNAPAQLFNNIYLRGGSNALCEFWQEQKAQGLAHITLNLKPTSRPTAEVLQDLAENVLAKM